MPADCQASLWPVASLGALCSRPTRAGLELALLVWGRGRGCARVLLDTRQAHLHALDID